MPLTNSKADNNVPHIGPRRRYSILCSTPTWVYHEMASGKTLNGEAPKTASVGVADLDPTIASGSARYTSLDAGGLFTILAHEKRGMVVESVDNPGTATLSIIQTANPSLSRSLPTAPFLVGPGECLKATGGSAASKIGFLVRIACNGDDL